MAESIYLFVDELYENYGITTDPNKIRNNINLINSSIANELFEKVDELEETTLCLTAGRYLCLVDFSYEKKAFTMIFFDCENNTEVLYEMLKAMESEDSEHRQLIIAAFKNLEPMYEQNYNAFILRVEK